MQMDGWLTSKHQSCTPHAPAVTTAVTPLRSPQPPTPVHPPPSRHPGDRRSPADSPVTAYRAHSSWNDSWRSRWWMGTYVSVPNAPLMRPTISWTIERRRWYSGTSVRDGTAICAHCCLGWCLMGKAFQVWVSEVGVWVAGCILRFQSSPPQPQPQPQSPTLTPATHQRNATQQNDQADTEHD